MRTSPRVLPAVAICSATIRASSRSRQVVPGAAGGRSGVLRRRVRGLQRRGGRKRAGVGGRRLPGRRRGRRGRGLLAVGRGIRERVRVGSRQMLGGDSGRRRLLGNRPVGGRLLLRHPGGWVGRPRERGAPRSRHWPPRIHGRGARRRRRAPGRGSRSPAGRARHRRAGRRRPPTWRSAHRSAPRSGAVARPPGRRRGGVRSPRSEPPRPGPRREAGRPRARPHRGSSRRAGRSPAPSRPSVGRDPRRAPAALEVFPLRSSGGMAVRRPARLHISRPSMALPEASTRCRSPVQAGRKPASRVPVSSTIGRTGRLIRPPASRAVTSSPEPGR